MTTPISPADQALIDKWLARKRVATVPVCSACQQECDVETEDHGGMGEFWGKKEWHEQLTDVSGCCGEEIDYMTPDEYENLEAKV